MQLTAQKEPGSGPQFCSRRGRRNRKSCIPRANEITHVADGARAAAVGTQSNTRPTAADRRLPWRPACGRSAARRPAQRPSHRARRPGAAGRARPLARPVRAPLHGHDGQPTGTGPGNAPRSWPPDAGAVRRGQACGRGVRPCGLSDSPHLGARSRYQTHAAVVCLSTSSAHPWYVGSALDGTRATETEEWARMSSLNHRTVPAAPTSASQPSCASHRGRAAAGGCLSAAAVACATSET